MSEIENIEEQNSAANPFENIENEEQQTTQENENQNQELNTNENLEEKQPETPQENNENKEEQVEEKKEEKEMDPRALQLNEQLIKLLNAAQGIWKDALESQVRLTVKADYLQESLDQIKQLSALPNYPAGMKQLQNSINRVQICKKRIVAVQNRLNKLNMILNPQNQR